MEKMGDEAAAKFINALIKSVQTLCHGYLDFQTGIEIIGHINLSVDKGTSLDYILKEKVCKNAENSTLFISNSFHAEPKPEQEVPGKNSQSDNQVNQNNDSADSTESGRVSSAISSISSALAASGGRPRRNSGSKDSSSSHPHQSTAKRKATDDPTSSDFHPAKLSSPRHSVSHLSETTYPAQSPSPVDSKEALQALGSGVDVSVLPQTASVRTDGSGDIGVNLAGSVLEPVEDQGNSELAAREEDSDGDLEVTFIKEEFMEGEGSACEYENSSGQQFGRGSHQRASEGMPDASLYPVSLHGSSASASYVPGPSTSQPQPGPSNMRDGTQLARSILDKVENVDDEFAALSSYSEGKFHCSVCGYSNSRVYNMKRHMRCHTGHKFRCVKCSSAYNCKYKLQQHYLWKHGCVLTAGDNLEQSDQLKWVGQASGDHMKQFDQLRWFEQPPQADALKQFDQLRSIGQPPHSSSC